MNEVYDFLYPSAMTDWYIRSGFNYPIVLAFALFWSFGLGSCLGSFLNVCIWRIPRGESLSAKCSHCGSCNTPIKWYDNIPVVSYLVLRGRCRACKTHYSCRYLLVELLCGAIFTGIFLKIGLTRQPMEIIANYSWMTLYCVGIAWIDAEHRIIPDKLTYPAIIMGLLFAVILPGAWGMSSPLYALIYAIISGVIPSLFLALFAIIGRRIAKTDVLGWGDVKYILACGILIGLPGAIFTILAGALTGTAGGVIASLCRKKRLRRATIPFGPFLALGSLIWIFAGNWILKWYISLSI